MITLALVIWLCAPLGRADCIGTMEPVTTWLHARHVAAMLRQWRIDSTGKMI